MRPAILFGYITGTIMFVVGVLVLMGVFDSRWSLIGSAALIRNVFGVLALLYGIYRIVITDTHRRRDDRMR
ncbi:MAG: hypothetical protein JST22_10815 [Bacteroidetes bacterium]|nr:hypothetical protein [Bacteroidota bacterium]